MYFLEVLYEGGDKPIRDEFVYFEEAHSDAKMLAEAINIKTVELWWFEEGVKRLNIYK